MAPFSTLFLTLVVVTPLLSLFGPSIAFQTARAPRIQFTKSAGTRTSFTYRERIQCPTQLVLLNTINSNNNAKSDQQSLSSRIDDFGQSLKAKAARSSAKATMADSKITKIAHLAQTMALYSLFILYRSYRGFFVILPAVFRNVYEQLETSVNSRVFDDTSMDNGAADDVKQPVRWRTRVTVSVLASIVTISYALAGAARVVIKLGKSLSSGRDVSSSFAAAAKEQEDNERKIVKNMKLTMPKNKDEEMRP
jgi:hypothetical protein